jgi:hypothetical protein
MKNLAEASTEEELGENPAPLAAIMFAGCQLTEVDARAYGGRIPRGALKRCMTTLFGNIGRHNGRVLKKTESTVTAYFEDPGEAVKSAINIQIENQHGSPEDCPLVIRVAVDYTWNDVRMGSEKGFDDNVIKAAQILDSGGILVSKAIRSSAEAADFEFKEVRTRKGFSDTSVYYSPLFKEDRKYLPSSTVLNTRFIHGTTLVKGPKSPCFYCGSKSHDAATCPSKVLPQITRGLHNIGFMTIHEMNNAFQAYIEQGLEDSQSGTIVSRDNENSSPVLAAHYAFYELSRVFQLRFLNAMWDPQDHSSWSKLRLSDRMPLTGGKLRIAFDCLRTYQLDQAEELLKAIEWTNPRDFRYQCLMGFVNVERKTLSIANHYFTKAYEYANGVPQKLYALLLRYRALLFDGKKRQAEDILSLCLSLDRTCPEVNFEDIIAKIASEKEKDAVSHLEDLVAVNSEYWTAVMISPDLALHFDLVVPELSRLLEEAGKDSRELMKGAKEALMNLEKMLSEGDTELAGLKQEYEQIKEMAEANTFFSWQKILKAAPALVSACSCLARDRQGKVREALCDLENRLSCAVKSPYGGQSSIRSKLRAVNEGITAVENDLVSWQPYEELLSRCEGLAKLLEDGENKIAFLERTALRLEKIRGFVKDFTLFLAIGSISTIALSFLFLNFIKPTLPLGTTNIGWVFDSVAVMVLISSVFYALVRSVHKGRPVQRYKSLVKAKAK